MSAPSSRVGLDVSLSLEGPLASLRESKLWVALAVTSLSAFANLQLGLTGQLPALSVVFFSTLLIYNLDRYIDLTRPARSSVSVRPAAMCAVSMVFLAFSLALCNFRTVLLVAPGALVCALYAVPITRRGFRLKAIPGTKSVFVGAAVSTAVVAVPLCSAEAGLTQSVLGVWLLLFAVAVLNATLLDVFDTPQDRLAGLPTLPMLLGRSSCLRLVACVTLLLGGLATLITPSTSLAAAVTGAALVGLLWLFPKITRRATLEFCLDGALLLPLIAECCR